MAVSSCNGKISDREIVLEKDFLFFILLIFKKF